MEAAGVVIFEGMLSVTFVVTKAGTAILSPSDAVAHWGGETPPEILCFALLFGSHPA
jgi:hypothetical protein